MKKGGVGTWLGTDSIQFFLVGWQVADNCFSVSVAAGYCALFLYFFSRAIRLEKRKEGRWYKFRVRISRHVYDPAQRAVIMIFDPAPLWLNLFCPILYSDLDEPLAILPSGSISNTSSSSFWLDIQLFECLESASCKPLPLRFSGLFFPYFMTIIFVFIFGKWER